MGSVEVFPGRRGAANLADVWRTAPVPLEGIPRVRAARLDDCAAIRALQRQAQPFMAPCSARQLESRLRAFAPGQMVATSDGQVVGAAASLVVQWPVDLAGPTWKGITGDGCFATHEPGERTLYVAELVADASRRGFGIARALSQAQRRLCRRMNLQRIVVTARLAGYAAASARLSPEHYAMRVIWGDLPDPELRFRMGQGFQYCGILRGFLPEDADSCGHAALLAWLDPLYAPPGPPAFVAPQRQQRKCA